MLEQHEEMDSAPRGESAGNDTPFHRFANGKITFDLPRDEYDRQTAVNWSKLKHILRSPKHYRHALLEGQKDTDALKVGRAAHLAVLEPEKYRRECVVWEGGIRRGKEWDAFKRKHSEREILKPDEHALCLALQNAVRADPDAAKFLAAIRTEVSMEWDAIGPGLDSLPGYRMRCKGRIDALGAPAIVDLKTTRDASPSGFGIAAWKLKYHAQAAFYVDGYAAATGEVLPYVLIVVETVAPYVVQVYRVLEEQLDAGREIYRGALERLAFCTRENTWDGYATGEQSLVLPQWAVPHVDDDVSELGLEFGTTTEE